LKSLKPQGFRNQPSLSPPAGYICVLRDVSYGDRYQVVQLQDPNNIGVYLKQSFDVEIALVFQASDARQSMGELLDFVNAEGAGEWFDLAEDRFKSLRSLGTAGRAHRRFSRPSSSLADLLANSEPRAAQQPAAPPRRTETAAAAPRQPRRSVPDYAPGRRQRPEPASVASRQRSATPAPVSTQPRPRNRRGKFFVLLFAMLLFGLLYQPLSNRDLFEDLQNLIGTESQDSPQAALSKPVARVASISQTSVEFAWKAAPGATNYRYRYALNEGGFSIWQSTNSHYRLLSGLDPGDRIIFELLALRGNELTPVTRLTARTKVAPTATTVNLQRPTARVAYKTAVSIRLEWDALEDATGYQYRYQVNDGGFSYWRSTNSRTFTVADLESGDQVKFELRALRGSARSPVTRLTARTTVAPAATSTQALQPTATATQSPEPSATNSPVPRATASASPEPSPTRLPSETPTREPEPSATNSPEPTATLEPSATATLQTMFVETRNNLGANARICPRTNCEILVTLRPGAEIQALGRVEGEEVYDSTLWIQFDFNGELAYIHSELVEIRL